ncbi:MAG: FMN-binding protein [Bacteroidales bacterium]|jgi:hypothetical protein|nr:FMN-binding protein [Bacteroidales bacterium]
MNKFLLVIGFAVLTAFTFPSKFDKKVNKVIEKIWDISSFESKPISLPDSIDIKLYSIVKNDSLIGYFSINKVNACRIGGCDRPSNTRISDYENFSYLSVFDNNFLIKHIKVLEYNAEYGYEICSKNWLKQFIGKTGGNISYSNDIDAISGATISGTSITDNINYVGGILKTIRKIEIQK